MQKFVITTDNMADLPETYYGEHQIPYMYLPYTMDGETYRKENELKSSDFYNKMRNGSMPTTSQVNSEDAKELWKPFIEDGYDILHIAFSSGLSGSYNSCRIAAEEIAEEYPQRKVTVIDSLCASLGEGLFVHLAVKMKESGKSMDEIIEWLESHKMNLCHVFTVDDLNHLHRGGRVSKMTAVIGTMINIKPVLHVDEEGHLIAVSKVRGRKRSLITLVNMMEERLKDYTGGKSSVFISHGDCLEDAQFVAKLVKERFGTEDILINPVGSTIGAHSGPGTVALFFLGSYR
ncbi:DegV family protein [Lawsonibacter sp. OA9]|uniref:DegV family protein n=1 Tax=Oscillospiraceae TaxID=216572 RepID=UPI001F063DB4|nr:MULTISPECIES: DegV family protein [Oscillospiraceae]MCH1980922.1 DegV family protein [Lawsonibacter sp. OA9]MCH1984220.1 DegV family protein [Ruminococcus sp. OA3]